MSEKVRLVVLAPESTRRALRVEAARLDLDMSELATVVLDATLSLMAAGKTPDHIAAGIDRFRRAEGAKPAAEVADRPTRARKKK